MKCHQYWPDERGSTYGSIRVHIQEILVIAQYTVRTFRLTKIGSKDERIVTQYHCTIWPDHGVPDYPTSFLQFVRKVMDSNPSNTGPVVVHCSAGVGRTGVFITLHSQLSRIVSERNLNVFHFVRSMRYNRCFMVQTEVSVMITLIVYKCNIIPKSKLKYIEFKFVNYLATSIHFPPTASVHLHP